MALDFAGLMTVAGEIIKKIDIFDALISSLETYKDDIYTDLAAEGYQDYYAPMPAQFLSMKNAVSSWISTLKSDLTAVFTDPELVLDELPINSFDVTSVLNGLYDYMVDNSQTIESSVVSLGGSDTNNQRSANSTPTQHSVPVLFVSRCLDGTSSPGNGVTAHTRYNGAESQLARTGTIYAKLLNNTTIGAETASIYSELPASGPYLATTENPGQGPTLTNPENANLVSTNASFTTWSGDSPTGWTLSGTVTTDYGDASGVGNGPLRILTDSATLTSDMTAIQKINGLVSKKLYFVGCYFTTAGAAGVEDTVEIRLRNLAGTTVSRGIGGGTVTGSANVVEGATYSNIAYTFAYLADSISLDDVYVEVEYSQSDSESDGAVDIRKVVVAPATYFNGLAWTWWPPYHTSSDPSKVVIGDLRSIAVSNNNNGKFQTAFRRLYNIQLPTADSPTVADSLAGG